MPPSSEPQRASLYPHCAKLIKETFGVREGSEKASDPGEHWLVMAGQSVSEGRPFSSLPPGTDDLLNNSRDAQRMSLLPQCSESFLSMLPVTLESPDASSCRIDYDNLPPELSQRMGIAPGFASVLAFSAGVEEPDLEGYLREGDRLARTLSSSQAIQAPTGPFLALPQNPALRRVRQSTMSVPRVPRSQPLNPGLLDPRLANQPPAASASTGFGVMGPSTSKKRKAADREGSMGETGSGAVPAIASFPVSGAQAGSQNLDPRLANQPPAASASKDPEVMDPPQGNRVIVRRMSRRAGSPKILRQESAFPS